MTSNHRIQAATKIEKNNQIADVKCMFGGPQLSKKRGRVATNYFDGIFTFRERNYPENAKWNWSRMESVPLRSARMTAKEKKKDAGNVKKLNR